MKKLFNMQKFNFTTVATLIFLMIAGESVVANGISIEDISRLKQVTNLQLSEDERYIAYNVKKQADPKKENKSPSHHLHVYDVENDESKPYYTRSNAWNISFRPGKNSITFLSSLPDEGQNALFEMPLTGGEAQELYRFENSISQYQWASDGNRLAFTAREKAEQNNDFPIQPDIYEEGLRNIKGYILDLSDQEEPDKTDIQQDGTIYKLRWGPDDEKIAISVASTPLVDHQLMFQSVKVIDAANGQEIADIENEGKLDDIRWSPDGEQLALLAGHNIHDPIAGRIMVADADGGTPENIYRDFEGKFESIRWTSNNEIHFLASESTERGYGSIAPDGSNFDYIIDPGGLIFTQFSRPGSGKTALLTNTFAHPNEVYLKDEGRSPERVTNYNPWLEDRELGQQSTITYEARDGKEIDGVLIRPIDYQEGESVPLIVEVHGGPEAHYDNGWLTDYRKPGQEGPAKGYAVFYPNYRGSTGRGIDFIKSSQGDAAGAEFDDVVDGVQHLIDEGIADENRIGVTGSSYGGFATAWMSTYYSEYFAAGFMNVGVSNQLSKWGTSDIPQELYLVHSREWLWENDNWQKYLERSPIYHVDNAETPLKIVHGAADTRVHPGQSLELYRHLSVRKPDLPVRFLEYEGEGHSYSGASVRYDYNLRMFRWFDTFLKGDGEKPDIELDY